MGTSWHEVACVCGGPEGGKPHTQEINLSSVTCAWMELLVHGIAPVCGGSEGGKAHTQEIHLSSVTCAWMVLLVYGIACVWWAREGGNYTHKRLQPNVSRLTCNCFAWHKAEWEEKTHARAKEQFGYICIYIYIRVCLLFLLYFG